MPLDIIAAAALAVFGLGGITLIVLGVLTIKKSKTQPAAPAPEPAAEEKPEPEAQPEPALAASPAPESESAARPKFCSGCGAQLPDIGDFCPECGKKI